MTRLPDALFRSPLPGLGRPLTETEGALAANYLNLLTKWSKTQRLVGSVEPMWLIENVFLDSLCFLAAIPPEARRLADVGSGAGIPGIPVAIVSPELEVDLIESRQRRVSFLSTAVRELSLPRVRVVGARVEDLSVSHSQLFDAITVRCAGDVRAIIPRVLPLLRPGGVLVISASPGSSGRDGDLVVTRTLNGRPRTFQRIVKPLTVLDRIMPNPRQCST